MTTRRDTRPPLRLTRRARRLIEAARYGAVVAGVYGLIVAANITADVLTVAGVR